MRGRFAAAGVLLERISFSRETFLFRAPMEPTAFVAVLRNFYGPVMNAFEDATQAGTADALQRELEALASAHNTSTRADTTVIAALFIKVVVAL